MSLTYDPATPQVKQRDSWSCLAKALAWSLRSYGLPIREGQVEGWVLSDHVTSRGGYLTDKTGHEIAEWSKQLFGLGLVANYTPNVTWEEVVSDAGRNPTLFGRRPSPRVSQLRPRVDEG
jgi:hypothetical protein